MNCESTVLTHSSNESSNITSNYETNEISRDRIGEEDVLQNETQDETPIAEGHEDVMKDHQEQDIREVEWVLFYTEDG